jgi:hypothetical protein
MRTRLPAVAVAAALLSLPGPALAAPGPDVALPGGADLAIAGTAAHPVWHVNGVGDVNGDGTPDYALAGPNGVSVVFGDPDLAPVDLDALGDGGFHVSAGAASVAAAGDVNGDGLADVVIGSPSERAYVVFGKADAAPVDVDALGSGGIVVAGPPAEQSYPESIYRDTGADVSSAGDFNGDGYDDVAIAAPGYGTDGATYVVLGGPRAGSVDLASPGGRALELSTNAYSLAPGGDRDGDGRDELVVAGFGGAASGPLGGEPYARLGTIVFGVAGAHAGTPEPQATAEARLAEQIASSELGQSPVVGPPGGFGPAAVARVGDYDGNGRTDFTIAVDGGPIVGDDLFGGRRFAWIALGHAARGKTLDLRASGAAVALDAPELASAPDYRDTTTGTGGDVDGDGEADAIVAVAPLGPEGESDDASAWVVRGTRRPRASIDLGAQDDGFRILGAGAPGGWRASGGAIGDVDGDGREEILLASDGTAYLLRGR